jgi:hypothetical protein
MERHLMLRYTGKNQACVQLSGTGAVVSVELPWHAHAGVEGYKRLTGVSPAKPCPVDVELGEYQLDKFCFACRRFVLADGGDGQGSCTTRYRRIVLPTI